MEDDFISRNSYPKLKKTDVSNPDTAPTPEAHKSRKIKTEWQ